MEKNSGEQISPVPLFLRLIFYDGFFRSLWARSDLQKSFANTAKFDW